MREYEVLIETVEPCGGAEHKRSELADVKTDSPEEYVRAHAPFPVLDVIHALGGDTVIVTGDGRGYITKYTFTD